jgi:hypothetical protein
VQRLADNSFKYSVSLNAIGGGQMGDNFDRRDWPVAVVGVCVIGLGIALALNGVKVDQSIAILIAIGTLLLAWPVLSTRLAKFSIGKDGLSVELKDKIAAVESKVASAQTGVSFLARRVERGREARLAQSSFLNLVGDRLDIPSKFETAAMDWAPPKAPTFEDDPLKGRFGGLNSRDGRTLMAKVRPHPSVPEWAIVDLKVEALPNAPRIADPVTFHLHPTFAPNDVQVISPDSAGVVRLEITSYGAFTVGVDAGHGVQLELDLATADGAFEPWKDR